MYGDDTEPASEVAHLFPITSPIQAARLSALFTELTDKAKVAVNWKHSPIVSLLINYYALNTSVSDGKLMACFLA